MKKVIQFLFVCIILMMGGAVQSRALKAFSWRTDFHVFITTPPAFTYLTDSQGRMAGADPSVPFNDDGSQGSGADGVTEIPDSHVLQVNEGVLDGNGALESATSTGWSIDVHDSQAQVYGLHLVGMETGIVEVETSILQSGIPGSADNNFKILITKGESREVQLTVNPSEKIVTAQPVVGKEDLLSDVEAACQVDLITSRRACEFLTLQAKIIARAVNKQHDEEAKAGLWVFLHALGYSRPSGCRDGDHHDEVKQPALGILQEDAKALLTQIGPPARHFGEKDR